MDSSMVVITPAVDALVNLFCSVIIFGVWVMAVIGINIVVPAEDHPHPLFHQVKSPRNSSEEVLLYLFPQLCLNFDSYNYGSLVSWIIFLSDFNLDFDIVEFIRASMLVCLWLYFFNEGTNDCFLICIPPNTIQYF